MRDAWESYNFVVQYSQVIHEGLKANTIGSLNYVPLGRNFSKQYSKNATFGAISHLQITANPRRTLIDAVACCEEYLGDLVRAVFSDYPARISVAEKDNNEREGKLLDMIINSKSRDEIIERIIEERVRGLFYDAPTDFFLKSRVRLEFGTYFLDNCKNEIDQYREIAARRNALIHNDGKIDRKYVRETGFKNAKLGEKIPIDASYLSNAIQLLVKLAAIATALVFNNIYKQPALGVLGRRVPPALRKVGTGKASSPPPVTTPTPPSTLFGKVREERASIAS